MSRFRLILSLLIFCAFVLVFPNSAQSFYPGRIVFIHEADYHNSENETEIYTMNIDGSDVRVLTDNDFADMDPLWSPDGQYISFYSNRTGTGDVFVMDQNGDNVINVSNNQDHSNYRQTWSPDSQQLTYVENIDPTNINIWTSTLDGSPSQKINQEQGSFSFPRWSGAGDRIAYSKYDSDTKIYIADSDGSNTVILSGVSTMFNWSPSGDRLLYVQDGNLWTVDPYGLDAEMLYDPSNGNVFFSANPVWSSDGESIAFVVSESTEEGFTRALYTIGADGQGLNMLFDIPQYSTVGYLNWTPDGRYLVFCMFSDSYQIYSLDLLTSELTQLTFDGDNSKPHLQMLLSQDDPPSSTVPEPATVLLFGFGILGGLWRKLKGPN